jgi:hypothetical protein
MLLSLTLRNEVLMGAEHGAQLRNRTLIGLSFSICSQGERLTGAFNFLFRPLSEGRILKKMVHSTIRNRNVNRPTRLPLI